jgi:hypothetical protein
MKWTLIGAAAIAAACVTSACSESGNVVEPSSLPSVQPSSLPWAARQAGDGPTLCTNLEPCPGGVDAGPPPEQSCSMMTNGIDVVVLGSRQRDGAWLAAVVGQVPPGTQPAPPGDEVVGPPPGSGDGIYTVARGDALGHVADLQGACPNLTFTVGGSPVVTNGSTRYFGLPSPPPPRP